MKKLLEIQKAIERQRIRLDAMAVTRDSRRGFNEGVYEESLILDELIGDYYDLVAKGNNSERV